MLTAVNGTWNDSTDVTPGALTYAYQWQRADDAVGTGAADIAAATSATYTVVPADSQKYIRVRVTATDDGEGVPATASLTVDSSWVPVANSAPSLNIGLTYTLTSVTEDQAGNSGTLVSAIIASGGGDGITDPDAGALEGIAVIAADQTYGTWEYKLSAPSAWTALGAVNSGAARLLNADAETLLRFVPEPTYNNAQSPTIVFRAWDRTGGFENGSAANITLIGTGGSTPFSTGSDTASITVTAVNDAPVLDNTGNMSLATIAEDIPDAENVGTLVRDIILSAGGDRITDVDTGTVEGIALIGVDSSNGTWQFSTNNGVLWNACGSLSDPNATVLVSNSVTRIRFVPAANFSGSAFIVFRAWDGTSGQSNGATGINVSVNGGTTAFSAASETASLTVTDVNEVPVITEGATTSVTSDEDNSPTAFALTLHATDGDGDTLTWSVQTQAAHGTATASGTGTSKVIGYYTSGQLERQRQLRGRSQRRQRRDRFDHRQRDGRPHQRRAREYGAPRSDSQ